MRAKLFLLGVLAAICLAFAGCEGPGNESTGDDEGDKKGVLINGVKWAMRNVAAPGTFAAAPEDFGMLYQWGKNVGWSSTDPLVSSDGDEVWDATPYDGDEWLAANDPCPAGWRVPTHDEFIALCDEDAVNIEWTTQNGVAGRLFSDQTTDKSIFLPAAGYRNNSSGTPNNQGTGGYYWSSTPLSGANGYTLLFFGSSVGPSNSNSTTYGFGVRCVRP